MGPCHRRVQIGASPAVVRRRSATRQQRVGGELDIHLDDGAELSGRRANPRQPRTTLGLTMTSSPPWDRIAEWIPHVVWVTDAQGLTEYFNRRGYELVGLTPEETSGWGWLRVVHPDDASRARDAWVSIPAFPYTQSGGFRTPSPEVFVHPRVGGRVAADVWPG